MLTAMVTPFDADGRVDEEAAVTLAATCSTNGSHGLVVGGTTGEAATLTDEEQLGLIGLIAEESATRADRRRHRAPTTPATPSS